MYNDQSGEVLPFLVGIGIGWFAATVLSGAIIGAAISMGIYILQATINNNFSLGGFVKSIIMGAATGAVSAGLGEVFSAGSFLSTVANGALTGAGTGGVTALITGQNFLEGVLKGAVIGGGVAAVSWGIIKMVNAANVTKGNHEYKVSDSPINNAESPSDNLSYSYGTVHKFQDSYGGLGNYGVDNVYLQTPEGYGLAKNGLFYKKSWLENLFGMDRNVIEGNTLGVTTPSNNIYLSKGAFASKSQFVNTITHEVGHVILQNSKYASLALGAAKNMGEFSGILDDMGHISIRKMSIDLFNKNAWLDKFDWMRSLYFQRFLKNSNPNLDKLLLPLIKSFKF